MEEAEARVAARTPPSPRGPGRPPVPAGDVAKVLLAQAYFGVPNRVAEGLLRLLWRNLGLRGPFSYKTIERGYDRAAVEALLEAVLALTNVPVQGLDTTFSIDGSGRPTRLRQHYAGDARRKGKGKEAFPRGSHDYLYWVGAVGVRCKVIAAWRGTTDHRVGELAFFDPVVRETHARHPGMRRLLGDALYTKRRCCRLVADLGAVPRFFPRRDATFQWQGVRTWGDMHRFFLEDPQAFLAEYYEREASEGVNSVIARRNPSPLRKRLDRRRITEGKLEAVCHNLLRLAYLRYLENLRGLPAVRAA